MFPNVESEGPTRELIPNTAKEHSLEPLIVRVECISHVECSVVRGVRRDLVVLK